MSLMHDVRRPVAGADLAAIRGGLDVVLGPAAPDNVAELRVLDTPQKAQSGYYDDWDLLARDAARWSGKAPAVYATLNRVNPALLARAPNRLVPRARYTTSDHDIVGLRWLPVDFDPVRPAGISSSDEEHEAAIARAKECGRFMMRQGWPEPIVADSGNGGHLLFPIDLPPEDAGLVKQALAALAWRWDDERVQVDQTTFNPARVWKVYGLLACKGADMPGRPHRLARLLYVPD
jgi:hypothetical protein